MEPVEIDILDHGKVVLLDVFGNDARIAEAARRSYQKGTKQVNADRGLIRYLMRKRHTSPFEMAEVLFFLKLPILSARQLVRHRTANMNELSGRYSEMPEEFWIPELDDLGPQSKENNQGRAPMIDEIRAKMAQQHIKLASAQSYETYDRLLNVSNVSREVSRSVLPLNTYTELYWKCDLHNFFHFARLRMDHHAQKEIREMATAMYEAAKQFFPIAAEAFEDYILYAHTLSRLDLQLLATILRGDIPSPDAASAIGMSKREYTEFMEWYIALTTSSER
jgi:thymidylate synthase (FAD)